MVRPSVAERLRQAVTGEAVSLPAVRREGAPTLVVGTAKPVRVDDHAGTRAVRRVDNRMQRHLAAERAKAHETAQALKDLAALYGLGELVQDRFADYVLAQRDRYVDEEDWGLPTDQALQVPTRWAVANARATQGIEALNQDVMFLLRKFADEAGEIVDEPAWEPDTRHWALRLLDPFPEE